jgi:hypothetical protein
MSEKHEYVAPESEKQLPAEEQRKSSSLEASKRASLSALLNSNFCLFVCSSVILGLISFGYHQWIKYKDDQTKIEPLDFEISFRLRDMSALAQLPDRNRYNNVENIQRVDDGDTRKFWVRRVTLPKYENKNTMGLMVQLYFLVPAGDRPEIRRAIDQLILIDRLIPEIRLKAASEPELPPAKTREQQERQDEDENKLKKDFGQNELFSLVTHLAESPRWKHLTAGAANYK